HRPEATMRAFQTAKIRPSRLKDRDLDPGSAVAEEGARDRAAHLTAGEREHVAGAVPRVHRAKRGMTGRGEVLRRVVVADARRLVRRRDDEGPRRERRQPLADGRAE